MPSPPLANRRQFLASTAAALATTPLAHAQQPAAKNEKGHPTAIPGYFASRPGIQLGTQMPANATEEDMQFTRQLGVEWVMTGLRAQESSLESYQALIRRFAAGGLKIYRLANDSCHNMEQVTLNLPGRDTKIEEYLAYIRLLGKAGIYYSTYAHMGNGIWSSPTRDETRGSRGGGNASAENRARRKWEVAEESEVAED